MEYITIKSRVKKYLSYVNILIILTILSTILYKDFTYKRNSFLVNETLIFIDRLLYDSPESGLFADPPGGGRRETPLSEALDARLSQLSPKIKKGIPAVDPTVFSDCTICESPQYLTDLSIQIKKNAASGQNKQLYHDAALITLLIVFSGFHFKILSGSGRGADSAVYGREPAADSEAYPFGIGSERLLERRVREIDIHGNLDQVLLELREILREKMTCDRIGLAFLDRNGEFSAETTYTDYHDIQMEASFHSSFDGSLLEDLMGDGKSLIINDLKDLAQNDVSPLTRTIIREGYRSCIVFPIRFRGHKVGYVIVLGREGVFSENEASYGSRMVELLKHKLYMEYILQHIIAHTPQAFVKLLHERDNETALHIKRMSLYSSIIACTYFKKYKDVPARLIREIKWFSSLHDIGKIGVPDHILMKQDKLTVEERVQMQEHVFIGESVIREISDDLSEYLSLPLMETAVHIIVSHHEKYDGSGYPRGLAGNRIPLEGRIVALADVFDALTSKRPYKEAYSIERAIHIMEREMEGHFDPEVFSCFLESLDEIKKIYESHKEV